MSYDNTEEVKQILAAIEAELLKETEPVKLNDFGDITAPTMTIYGAPDRDSKYYFIPKESDKRKPHRKHGTNYTPPKRRHRK